jgi:hypothetical protein
MSPREEREALEKLLADATRMSETYVALLKSAQTVQQIERLEGRLNRYNAVRTIIADLMLG